MTDQPFPSGNGQMDSAETSEEPDEDPIERIADPDNYNLRRRLRQLHDAKERVPEQKNEALLAEKQHKRIVRADVDELVAEAVVDYISELKSILKQAGRADELLEEEAATVGGEPLTIGDIKSNRGHYTYEESTPRGTDTKTTVIPYGAAMDAWEVCNDYFDEVAGPELKDDTMPGGVMDSTGSGRHR